MRKLAVLAFLALLLLPVARAQISGAGNLGCSGIAVSGTVINSGTANNTVVASLSNFQAWGVLVQLDQTTTVTGGAVTFNSSGDSSSNFSAVPVAQVLNPSTSAQLTNPYTLVANTNQQFLILLNGATNFQVKLTTAMNGTGAITPYITAICENPQPLVLDALGNLLTKINAALPAGANLIGETTQVTTATTTDTSLRCTLVSAASTNSTNCKASAGNVYGFRFVNTTTTVYYLRMYNSSSAPTCSSATGFIESIPIPPASGSGQAGGIVSIEPFGEGYSTGISFCFTGGSSSTDNTNAATGVFGTILYK